MLASIDADVAFLRLLEDVEALRRGRSIHDRVW
jgi:hypothetical protein